MTDQAGWDQLIFAPLAATAVGAGYGLIEDVAIGI